MDGAAVCVRAVSGPASGGRAALRCSRSVLAGGLVCWGAAVFLLRALLAASPVLGPWVRAPAGVFAVEGEGAAARKKLQCIF